jgi:hypothetical protein
MLISGPSRGGVRVLGHLLELLGLVKIVIRLVSSCAMISGCLTRKITKEFPK